MMKQRRSQGVWPGLFGLLFLLLFLIMATIFLLLGGPNWKTLPFTILLLITVLDVGVRLLTRIGTLWLVGAGRLAIVKTLSSTDVRVPQLGNGSMSSLKARWDEISETDAYEDSRIDGSLVRSRWHYRGRGAKVAASQDGPEDTGIWLASVSLDLLDAPSASRVEISSSGFQAQPHSSLDAS